MNHKYQKKKNNNNKVGKNNNNKKIIITSTITLKVGGRTCYLLYGDAVELLNGFNGQALKWFNAYATCNYSVSNRFSTFLGEDEKTMPESVAS